MTIKHIICDIDGCLLPGKGKIWDLNAVSKLAQYCLKAPENDWPMLFISTGRSQPFVEAVSNALGIKTPAICEEGSIVWDPLSYKSDFLINNDEWEKMLKIKTKLREVLPATVGSIEPNKEICISINLNDFSNISDSMVFINSLLQSHLTTEEHSLIRIEIVPGAIQIIPKTVCKAQALKHIINKNAYSIDDFAVIGDAINDLSLLKMAKYKFAPYNVSLDLKKLIEFDFISSFSNSLGVIDILKHICPEFAFEIK